MKEERFDRIIRKTFNDKYLEEPSVNFTDQVMEKMGVTKKTPATAIRPLRQKRGLVLMIILYALIFSLIFFIPSSVESVFSYKFPDFRLPTLSQYLDPGSGFSKLLIALILGGWLLIFLDNFIRKFFTR